MTVNLIFRSGISLIFSVALAINFSNGYINSKGKESFGNAVSPIWLPFYMLVAVVLGLFMVGFSETIYITTTTLFNVFLHIGIFYILLLIFMPFLRKHFSPCVTASLWIIPNLLYFVNFVGYRFPKPYFTIRLKGSWVDFVPYVWLAGFVIILAYKTVSHLVFRRKLLYNASKAEDTRVLEIFEQVRSDVDCKNEIPLYISSEVDTPLSVGMFYKKVFVILPDKSFTDEELKLIFRHEFIHIMRNDAATKLFIVFCNAACWFNPFMWFSMKKCSEDIELNCDEMALRGKDDSVRRKYAELILTSAGEERGFTTCLSANAKSLKFRLTNILHPKKKNNGMVLAGAVCFLLMMTCGSISFALESSSLNENVLKEAESVGRVFTYDNESISRAEVNSYDVKDKDAFIDYLSSFDYYMLTGSYEFNDAPFYIDFSIGKKDGSYAYITLSDGCISVRNERNNLKAEKNYVFYEKLDVDKLLSFTEEVNFEGDIATPELFVYPVKDGVRAADEAVVPGKILKEVKRNGQSGDIPFKQTAVPSLVEGFSLDGIELEFPLEPQSYAVNITVADEDATGPIKNYKGNEITDHIVPIGWNSHWVVDAVFTIPEEGIMWRVEFYFDVNIPE